jgi:hypothetical protein
MEAEPHIDLDALAAPAGEQSTDSPEISPEAYLGEVVLELMKSGESTSARQIVYALTLEKKVADGLFEDIMDEVQSLETAGKIARKGNGKYVSGENVAEARDIDTAPERPRSGSSRQSRKSRKKAGTEKAILDAKLRQAFGHPVEPRKGRRRRATPRPAKRTPQGGR